MYPKIKTQGKKKQAMNSDHSCEGSEREEGVAIDKSGSWSFENAFLGFSERLVDVKQRGSQWGYKRRDGRFGFSLWVLVVWALDRIDFGRIPEKLMSHPLS